MSRTVERNQLTPQTEEYLWRCPQCGASIRLTSGLAVSMARRAGGCQGCRAKATFERDHALIGLSVDFWARTGAWPQSDAWLEAIPAAGISILGEVHVAQGKQPIAGKTRRNRAAERI